MYEESGLSLGDARLVFVEEAGEPYGTQYVYLVNYISGEPRLSPTSGEAQVNELGQNLYDPEWLPVIKLAAVPFISEKLQQAILRSVKTGFPEKAVDIS